MPKIELGKPLQKGQQLQVRRDASGQVLENLRRMKLAGSDSNPNATIHVTFIDPTGVSLYIARGPDHGHDLEVFIRFSEVSWDAYFDPLGWVDTFWQGATKHYTKKFPSECYVR